MVSRLSSCPVPGSFLFAQSSNSCSASSSPRLHNQSSFLRSCNLRAVCRGQSARERPPSKPILACLKSKAKAALPSRESSSTDGRWLMQSPPPRSQKGWKTPCQSPQALHSPGTGTGGKAGCLHWAILFQPGKGRPRWQQGPRELLCFRIGGSSHSLSTAQGLGRRSATS